MASLKLSFCGNFDQVLATSGTPAVFTIDAGGELRLSPGRTRDAWDQLSDTVRPGWCHCLYRDRATGWVQYLLVTSPDLCRDHPRADIVRFADQASALAALDSLGRPPLCREAFPQAWEASALALPVHEGAAPPRSQAGGRPRRRSEPE